MRASPSIDETAHLAAGLTIWWAGDFSLYPVNPPLVRVVAALPVIWRYPDANWSFLQTMRNDMRCASRPEWGVGIGIVRDNPDQAMWFFTAGRWVCVPLSLIGGYFCWRWANELYGHSAGALAATLWCFSPNVIAWSATICSDVAAASLGIAACYSFRRWLRGPDELRALVAGIALGLAELAKMTWVILFAVWPSIWLLWIVAQQGDRLQLPQWKQAVQLAAILVVGLFVINLGYTFEGTFTRAGDFTFASRTLAGADSAVDGGKGGNRFAGGWLGCLPLPLPSSYVRGMDLQKVDFERGLPSYLCGHWSQHGWWYYYLVCGVLKEPLGIWAIGLLAVTARLGGLKATTDRQPEPGSDGRELCRRGWVDELVLLLPAITLMVFVSSQTGFSRHYRYVLPAFPFVFVWMGSVAQATILKSRILGVCLVAALTWAVTSSLFIYPHSMSYFNELAGGPMGGPRYLLDANIDWGQDILYLKQWADKHPEATPLHVAFSNSYSDALLGLGDRVRNLDVLETQRQIERARGEHRPEPGPRPGWYAVSVHRVHDINDRYQWFRQFTPAFRVGYSLYVYRISLDEANRTRRELGLPELSGAEADDL